MKKFFVVIFSRVLYTLLFVAVQLAALVLAFLCFREQFVWFYAACIFLSVIAGLHVINQDINPAYKIVWLIPIMLMPIFGGLLYLLYGSTRITKKGRQRAADVMLRCRDAMAAEPDASARLEAESPEAALHSRYITAAACAPPYGSTDTRYFPVGEDYYASLLEELEKADRFIFLEYFIIEEGKMWNGILDILSRKAAEGVDVRVMYDDLGCVFTLPRHYDRVLERMGIKTCVFHRFNSILDSRFNARDHRKICVIDGDVGFTGGINLADRYINEENVYGHWKDSGVLLRGQAVWNLTVMFLSLWDYCARQQDDFTLFRPSAGAVASAGEQGYVQPYTDVPVDDEAVGETVYLNIINRAKDYVYITTPYLIIDNEMINAMRIASKSGVDVRIITPGVADKKLVFAMTRSYYGPLLRAGVRIYEYTPGFIHAKNFVSDDLYGVVGTINLDYRSLYLHYECAAWMYRSEAVAQVKEDFLDTLGKCREITPDTMDRQGVFKRLWLALLRAFAPLM